MRPIAPEELGVDVGALPAPDRAAVLKDYVLALEDELKDAKARLCDACADMAEAGLKDAGDWRLEVRYAEGYALQPEPELLRQADPEAYDRLVREKSRTWVPTLTKEDFGWIYDDPEVRERMLHEASLIVEKPAQYILKRRKARWSWFVLRSLKASTRAIPSRRFFC